MAALTNTFIVLDEVDDVLAGGQAQPFSFFTDPLM